MAENKDEAIQFFNIKQLLVNYANMGEDDVIHIKFNYIGFSSGNPLEDSMSPPKYYKVEMMAGIENESGYIQQFDLIPSNDLIRSFDDTKGDIIDCATSTVFDDTVSKSRGEAREIYGRYEKK